MPLRGRSLYNSLPLSPIWTGLLKAVRDALDEARQHFPGGGPGCGFMTIGASSVVPLRAPIPQHIEVAGPDADPCLSRRHHDHRRFGHKGDTVKMGCCRRGRTAAQARRGRAFALHPHLSRLFFRHQGIPVTSRAISEPLTPAVNKLIEQDRRSIKLRLGPMLGCKQFRRVATSGQECLGSFTRRELTNGVLRRCPQGLPSARALRNPLFRSRIAARTRAAHDGFLGAKDTET